MSCMQSLSLHISRTKTGRGGKDIDKLNLIIFRFLTVSPTTMNSFICMSFFSKITGVAGYDDIIKTVNGVVHNTFKKASRLIVDNYLWIDLIRRLDLHTCFCSATSMICCIFGRSSVKISVKTLLIMAKMLFNILLQETIDIAINLIFNPNPNLHVTKPELEKLFCFATSQTHFRFINKFNNKIDVSISGINNQNLTLQTYHKLQDFS